MQNFPVGKELMLIKTFQFYHLCISAPDSVCTDVNYGSVFPKYGHSWKLVCTEIREWFCRYGMFLPVTRSLHSFRIRRRLIFELIFVILSNFMRSEIQVQLTGLLINVLF